MTKELAKNLEQEKLENLAERVKAIIVETVFGARMTLIEGKHKVGDEIVNDTLYKKYAKGSGQLIKDIAEKIGRSWQDLYFCVQFYLKYPVVSTVVETLPEGKNISWNKIRALLPEPKKEGNKELPEGKYRTVIIDPPWPEKKILREVRPNQIEEVDYLTLSVEQIRDFRDKKGKTILDLFNLNGCHVYLWTTHKHLPDALEILKAWGVKYQCVLTWIKNVGMTPYSWMYSTELVLFGRVGNLDLLKKGERLDFYGKVREHSRKPDEFYELVKKVSPAPRIDVFSREKREGFDQYGNEPNKFKNR